MQQSIEKIVKERHEQLDSLSKNNASKEMYGVLEELAKISKTEKYFSTLSTLRFSDGMIEDALQTVEEGIRRFSYSFSLHFNAALIHFTAGNYEKTFYHFGKCLRFASEEEDTKGVVENLEQLASVLQNEKVFTLEEIKVQFNKVKAITGEVDERIYPINRYGESIIRKVLDKGTTKENMTEMYKSLYYDNLDRDSRLLLKTERYLGHEGQELSYEFKKKTTIPFAYLEPETDLRIIVDKQELSYQNSTLKFGQYNYLTFEPGEVIFKSNKPIFLGHPITLQDEPLEKRLVVNLFIDGLSQTYLEEHGIDKMMPRTMGMFERKYRNTNCYASADWTYPSLAGLVTAVDTITHGQYHPSYVHDFSEKRESLIEKIKDAGYFTAAFTGDWRSNPLQGYGSSFNRTVFKNSLGCFGASELMEEAIDHLETFKDKNNYLWLVIPDLHDVADEVFLSINNQVNTPAQNRIQQNKGETSVLSTYDTNKIARYGEELKRIDLHMAVLLNYIQQNYNEEDYVIVIHSDHGQGYFVTEDEPFLAEGRTKVPFMLLGDVPNETSSKLMSNLDIYPTLLDILNIDYNQEQYHGQLLEEFGGSPKEQVLTESYHPGQVYRAAVHTPSVIFHFETIDLIDSYGRVDFEKYKTTISSSDDLKEKELKELELYFTNWILERRIQLQK